MIHRLRSVLLAAAGTAILIHPAVAQDTAQQQIDQLQERVEALTRQTEAIAAQQRRLQELEDAVRSVTGQMEENRHLLEELRTKLGQLQTTSPEPDPGPQPATPSTGPIAAPAPVAESQPGGPPVPQVTTPTQEQPEAAAAATFSDEEASYQHAYQLLGVADYPGAEEAFRAFIDRYPNGTLTDNAYYWLGEIHYVQKEYDEAAAAFARGFQSDPDNQKAADILLKLGLSLIALGNNPDACATFDRLATDYPDAPKRTWDRLTLARDRAGCE